MSRRPPAADILGEDALLVVHISVSLPTVSVKEDMDAGAFWKVQITQDDEPLVTLTLTEVGGADPAEVIDAKAADAIAQVVSGADCAAKEYIVVDGFVQAQDQNPALLLAHAVQWATIMLRADALYWAGLTLPRPVARSTRAERVHSGYRLDAATARAHVEETRMLLTTPRRGLRLVS